MKIKIDACEEHAQIVVYINGEKAVRGRNKNLFKDG